MGKVPQEERSVLIERNRKNMMNLYSTPRVALVWVKKVIGILIVFGIWQYVSKLNIVSTEYLPTAWAILVYSLNLLTESKFLVEVLHTLSSMLIGLILAIGVAVPAGLLLGRFPVAYRMTRLLVEISRPIPAVALAPLAILVFGLTKWATVSLVVWTSIWPILINSIYGMHSVDQIACQTARTFGFGRWMILLKVELPSSAPFIATGIRIALAIALSVAISGEMVAGTGQGLGGWIMEETSNGSLTPIYGATFVAGLLGYLLNSIMERLERKVFFWHSSFRKSEI